MPQLFSYITGLLLLVAFTTVSAGSASAQSRCEFEIQDPTRLTPRQYEIRDVAIEGLTSDRENYLINTSGLAVGTTISIPGDDIPDAIRRIHRTGIFSDVEICHVPMDGGVQINIFVQEQPRLQEYHLEGIRRSHRRDLRDRLTLLSGFAVTNSVKEQAVSNIIRYYREHGYWFTEVEIEEELTDDFRNRVTLTFHIDPGERLRVRRIRFHGNEEFSGRKLRGQLDTINEDKWWKIFKRHVYTQDDYEEAIDNLISFYRDHGFRDVRVLRDSIYTYDRRGEDDAVAIDIHIEEGPQYTVRNVTWEGNTVYTDEQLTTMLSFYEGDVFNETRFEENLRMRRDENDITSNYQNIGYLFFEIYPDIRVVGEDQLDLQFTIVENDIATIRDVSFSGNTKTHDDVVRRNLRTVPGDTYSRSAIMRSIRELSTLGYFNPEGIQPDLNPNPQENTVDVIYALDESQSTDNFEFSGGFGGQQIGVILAARVNFNNFSIQRMFEPGGWNPIPSGDGQRLSLGVQVTGRGYQSYSFSFQEPWLAGRPTSLGVGMSYDILNYRQQPGQQFNERNELFSSTVSIGRRLNWPDDYFQQQTSVSYQLYNVAGFQGIFSDGSTSLLNIRHQIERNSLDNFISPTAGSRLTLSAEVAPPIPGFGQFYKFRSGYQAHTSVIGKLILTSGVDYGYMGYFGTGQRSNFQRFFLGGTEIQQRQSFINDNIDMRGFPGGPTGVISPVDENRIMTGGQMFSKYSLELRYPAVSSEQIQVIPYMFADAGNTYANFNTFDPFDLKRAVGFGARLYLPILGLVDLSYGYRLDGTPESIRNGQLVPGLEAGQWEFLFNLGAPF